MAVKGGETQILTQTRRMSARQATNLIRRLMLVVAVVVVVSQLARRRVRRIASWRFAKRTARTNLLEMG